jgi:hypothetical protein
MERPTTDSFSAGHAAQLRLVMRNCKLKESATMSKVHFPGLDVHEHLIAAAIPQP